jgi:hypothetical protein
MLGRIMRACDGKDGAIVLDHAGNYHRHGARHRRAHVYSLDGKVKKPGGEGPTKSCPQCGRVIAAGCKTCPECGFVFPPKEVPAETESELLPVGHRDSIEQRSARWRRFFEKAARVVAWQNQSGLFDGDQARVLAIASSMFRARYGHYPLAYGPKLLLASTASPFEWEQMRQHWRGVAKRKGWDDRKTAWFLHRCEQDARDAEAKSAPKPTPAAIADARLQSEGCTCSAPNARAAVRLLHARGGRRVAVGGGDVAGGSTVIVPAPDDDQDLEQPRPQPSGPPDPNIARVPPHDLEAEQATLGSILLEESAIARVRPILSADDFYATKHRVLYEACLELHLANQPCDVLLVLRRLEDDGHLADVGGREYLEQLASCVPTSANAAHYAGLVREKSKKREQIRLGAELTRAGFNGEPADETTASAFARLEVLRESFAARDDDVFRPIGSMTKEGQVLVDWLVRGYLARGSVSTLVALPKAGKTTFAYAMAAAIQRGDPEFAGCACTSKGTCVVLTEEDDGVLAETAALVGLDTATTVAMTRRKAFPRRPLAADVDLALRAARRAKDCVLVIVDTFRFWANLPPKAENDAGAVQAAFQEIARLAAAGYAVLLLHHTRKAGGEDGTAASGSNALVGAADIVMELSRFGGERRGQARTLRAWGRHQRIPPEAVIELRDGRYTYAGEAEHARDRLREQKVLQTLAEASRWLTDLEVAEAAGGLREGACRAALRSLHAKGECQRTGRGGRGSPFLYASLNVPLHHSAKPQETGGAT